LAFGTLGFILLIPNHNVDPRLTLAIVLFVLASSAFEITQELRRAKLDPTRFLIVSAARSIVGFCFGLFVIAAGLGGLSLLISYALSYAVGGLFYWRSAWAPPFASFDQKLFQHFFDYGMVFAISSFLFLLYSTLDRLLIAYLLGEAAAGQYGAVGDLARQSLFVVAMSIASAVFPLAFRNLGTSGEKATYEHLRESAELFAAAIMPIALILILSANALSETVIGYRYAQAMAALLPVLVLARLLGAVSNFYIPISFQLARKPKLQLLNGVITLAASIMLIVLITPVFGLIGAAVAATLAEAIGLIFGIWLTRYSFKLPWIPWQLLRIFLCLLAMAASVYIEEQFKLGNGVFHLLAILVSASMTYLVCAFCLNVANVRTYLKSKWLFMELR
jgi:O-antigen/teichoic acid export membrane protein